MTVFVEQVSPGVFRWAVRNTSIGAPVEEYEVKPRPIELPVPPQQEPVPAG